MPLTKPILVIAFIFVCAAVGGALASRYLIHSSAASVRTVALARTQENLFAYINQRRARAHLRPLRYDERLSRLATQHTVDMIDRGFFAHDAPNGPSFSQRMAGLRRSVTRENLAWGAGNFATARGMLALWLDSPPHRRALLDPAMRRIGIAVLRGGPYRGQSSAIVTTADLSS